MQSRERPDDHETIRLPDYHKGTGREHKGTKQNLWRRLRRRPRPYFAPSTLIANVALYQTPVNAMPLECASSAAMGFPRFR